MKIEGYEEISEKEYNELPDSEGAYFFGYETAKTYYFKKAQKFPICFEDEHYKIKINGTGVIIEAKTEKNSVGFCYDMSFPLLVKAVEKAKEVMKKNGTNKRIP